MFKYFECFFIVAMIGKDIDETDMEIIKELRKKGRASYREIAEQIGVSPGTVQNRVEKLEEENVIKSYHAVVDWDKLDYGITSIIGAQVKSSALDKIVDKLRNNPHVYGIYTVTGEFDLFIAVKYKTMQDLNKFVRRELAKPDIEKTTTFIVLDTQKESREFLE